MPVVQFAGNEWGPAVTVDAESGGHLVDICDRSGVPVAFSCRSAHCGTCRVEVLEGLDLFHPPAADELALLRTFDSSSAHRLACQAVIRPLPGRVRLKWVGAP
jgi:ferredoxin